MITKEQGIELIKYFEGCKLKAYQDSVGIWTIGIGSIRYEDNSPVKEGDIITEAGAISLLSGFLRKTEEKVNELLKVTLKQHQFDAIMSLVYNIGIGAFTKSTILKKINNTPDDPSIGNEFTRWCRAGGKVVPGLLRRRKAEAQLYLTGKLIEFI